MKMCEVERLKKLLKQKKIIVIGKNILPIAITGCVFITNQMMINTQGDITPDKRYAFAANTETINCYVESTTDSLGNCEILVNEQKPLSYVNGNVLIHFSDPYFTENTNLYERDVTTYNIVQFDEELFKQALEQNDINIVMDNIEFLKLEVKKIIETTKPLEDYFSVKLQYVDYSIGDIVEVSIKENIKISVLYSVVYFILLNAFITATNRIFNSKIEEANFIIEEISKKLNKLGFTYEIKKTSNLEPLQKHKVRVKYNL